MPVADLITLIAQTGGMGGLAIFAIFMLNRVWGDRLQSEKQHGDHLNTLLTVIQDALNRNTEALTRLCERLDNSGSMKK